MDPSLRANAGINSVTPEQNEFRGPSSPTQQTSPPGCGREGLFVGYWPIAIGDHWGERVSKNTLGAPARALVQKSHISGGRRWLAAK